MSKQMLNVEVTLANYPRILHSLMTCLLADLLSKETAFQNPSVSEVTAKMLTETLDYAAGVMALVISELPLERREAAQEGMIGVLRKQAVKATVAFDKQRKSEGL